MVLALVHMDPDTFAVLGVWLDPERSAYLRTADGGQARTLGSEIMAEKGSAPTWDEWAEHLADSIPTVAMFQAIDRRDGEEPRHVLARAVAMEAVGRRKQSD